jgi:hypothetical protein
MNETNATQNGSVNYPEIMRCAIDKKALTMTGIYYLIDGNEIVYIGQGVNVWGRIGTHIAENSKVFDSFFFVFVPSEDLDDYETNEIIKYNPKYNEKLSSSKEFVTTLKLKEILDWNGWALRRFIKEWDIKAYPACGRLYYRIADFPVRKETP